MRGRLILRSIVRSFSECSGPSGGAQQGAGSVGSAGMAKSSPPIPSVAGLSAAVVRPAAAQEGPAVQGDKSGDYKVPEYFCYNTMSYYEAEIEMSKYRLPQPSSK